MEPFQPILISLLALNLAALVALVVRRARERRERRREQAIVDAATPRMQLRLAAIADASIVLEDPVPLATARTADTTADLEPAAVAAATAAAVPMADTPPVGDGAPAGERRLVWRDALVGLLAVACVGLVLAIVAPSLGGVTSVTPVEGAAPAPTPLSTRIAVTLPTDPPSPSPSLPLTVIERPIASFSCSHQAGLRVAFHSTSETWGEPATYHWDFGGDGSSSVADPKHRFSRRRGYDVSLVVSNRAGRSDAFTLHVHPDHGEGPNDHGRCR
jgi:PKD domain